MMNLNQTKFIGLTMELDLKAKEYKILCDKLDILKEKGINPNDERLLEIKKLFQKNHDEIAQITKQLETLNNEEKIEEKKKQEKYNQNNLFKNKKSISSNGITVIEEKNSFFKKILIKIKKIIKK